jgi:hypothetical protein
MLVVFGNVDDVSEGRDHVDVDAAEWEKMYPSSEIEFWKDIASTIYIVAY